jgi:tRNA threonylcarbamoyladenosine dehydratase
MKFLRNAFPVPLFHSSWDMLRGGSAGCKTLSVYAQCFHSARMDVRHHAGGPPHNGTRTPAPLILSAGKGEGMKQQHALSRTELLIGKESLERLRGKKVAVLGIGGVGGYSVEALARCGVGGLLIVDDDTVCLTNINRQIVATTTTIGRNKVDVMKERIGEIDPAISVNARCLCVTPENVEEVIDASLDYVIDALDTISAKIALIEHCFRTGIPIISCMGTGNKLDPTKFVVTDLYQTKTCPLAKVMRKELRKRNIPALKVVCSEEIPTKPLEAEVLTCKHACICDDDAGRKCSVKRQIPASISFVPPVAGFILAGEVIKDLARPASDRVACDTAD